MQHEDIVLTQGGMILMGLLIGGDYHQVTRKLSSSCSRSSISNLLGGLAKMRQANCSWASPMWIR